MRKRKIETNKLLQLPETILISIVTLLCFDATDEADIDDHKFSLQCVCRKFHEICNSTALWQNKPIVLPSGKFNSGVFKLIKRKNYGTEGICYHAYCRPHQKEYAVKRVRGPSENEGVPYYMLRVLSALRNLKHPGVNELLYVSFFGAKLYTIYPYVELTLQDILDPVQRLSVEEINGRGSITPLSPLSQHVAIKLMFQLLTAMKYLHSRGILHRNLKPKHILIIPSTTKTDSYMDDAVLKISDFSLARTTFHPPKDLTAEVITLWYRPPEILLGHQSYTSAVDMWSSGCIFAEMLEGRPLFAGISEIDQLYKIFSKLGSPRELSTCRSYKHYVERNFPDWNQNVLRNSMRSLRSDSNCVTADSSNQDTNAHSEHRCNDDACFDLLNGCFVLEPSGRLSAESACQHSCFKSVPSSSSEERSEHSDDARISAYLEMIPNSILQQHKFLLTLEADRIGHNTPRNDYKSSNAIDDTGWTETEESEDFAVTDWMISMLDNYSEFTCARTVFLAVSLMERFKRDCACLTAIGTDLVAFNTTCTVHPSGCLRSAVCESSSGTNTSKKVSGAVHLKLLGATCYHVASKLEDVCYIGVIDFLQHLHNITIADVTAYAYTVDDILQLEEKLLNRSDFNVYIPTLVDFLHIYIECVPKLKSDLVVQSMSAYLGEVTLLFPRYFSDKYAPSLIASSVILYSMTCCSFQYDSPLFQCLSGYGISSLVVCIDSIGAAHTLVSRSHRDSSVFKKYDTPKSLRVSNIEVPALTIIHDRLR